MAATRKRKTGVSEAQLKKILEDTQILSFAQAVLVSGRSDKMLRRAVNNKEIAAIRQGDRGHIFIRLAELQRYLGGTKVPPAQ